MVGRNLSAKGLEWVEARVPNYEEMKKFYRSTLGLPLNFEEERKDFIQFKVGPSKTYLALLDTKKTGMTRRSGFVPTFEVQDLDKFVQSMKKGVKVGRRVVEGDHVRLVDFFDPRWESASGVRMETQATVKAYLIHHDREGYSDTIFGKGDV